MAKNAADPAGHYSRPDVTCLLINNRKMRRVETFALPIERGNSDGESEG
jgi:aliphatic nitrilase